MSDAPNPARPRARPGGCLCGAVRFGIAGTSRGVILCHCEQCRRSHGSHGAYTAVKRSRLIVTERRGLKWYPSSEGVRRGFCGECGASLFWERENSGQISISAGAFDPPAGLATVGHVYVASAADFEVIADDLPKFERGSEGALDGDKSG